MASVHPNNEPGDDFIMPALPAEHISLEGYDEIGVVLPPGNQHFLKYHNFGAAVNPNI